VSDQAVVAAARAGDSSAFERLVAPHRRELHAHCYRMAGSWQDAEDLLQESLLRAWRGIAGFEGRSSVRTWLYRVATNACLDALDKRVERTLPVDLGPPGGADGGVEPPRLEPIWLGPAPGDFDDAPASPEARVSSRESVAFAFLTLLQKLPPKQRAVLILRDVMGWQASECAELLDLSVAAVNSALQRAREALGDAPPRRAAPPDSDEERRLLARYVAAWEGSEVGALVALLHEETVLSMPPIPTWFRGGRAIGASLAAMVLTPGARYTLRATRANGLPALGTWRLDGGVWHAASLQVLELSPGRVDTITAFLAAPGLFEAFGLPPVFDEKSPLVSQS
jgi:RNA polymerase sigma-70 factor, ECF subfamily